MVRRCLLLTCLACVMWLPAEPAQAQGKPDAAKASSVDLYGDPLPPGALARLGTVRFRRTTEYGMSGMAFLPDNKTVLTASVQEVQFWDVTNGKRLREFRTDPLQVTSFAMAPGDTQFAAAGRHPWVSGKPGPAEIRIFDIASGKTLQTLPRPDRDFSSTHLAFSPDGKLLFSVGYSGLFRV